MSMIRKRLMRRLGPLGRLADAALVGGAALRFAHRRGWLSDEQVSRAGLANWSASNPLSAADMMLAGGALWRLLRRKPQKKKKQKRAKRA